MNDNSKVVVALLAGIGMTRRKNTDSWELLPGSLKDIDAIRKKCRRLVLQRAAMSAGISVLPVPGLDIATDLTFLAKVIEDINTEFGLAPDQILRLQPKMKLIAYEMTVGMSGLMVGRVVTREVIARLSADVREIARDEDLSVCLHCDRPHDVIGIRVP